jgi:hypothetical protein
MVTVMTNQIEQLTKLVDQNTSSCRIVSVLYRKKGNGGKGKRKGDGEVSRQTILLNVDRDNSLKRDLSVLKGLLPTLTGDDSTACQELIDSIQSSLDGFNPEYTKHGYYDGHGNGNVQTSELSGSVYVKGYCIKKEVLVPGVYDPVNSRPKTISKNKLRKQLKNTRFREFIVTPENLKSLSVNGRILMLDLVGSFDSVTVNQVDGYTVQVNSPESVTV